MGRADAAVPLGHRDPGICVVAKRRPGLHDRASVLRPCLLALLVFRIGWGLIGSTTARFRDFLHPPRTVLAYLRNGAGMYAGHNPAGGLMVIALILVLLAQAVTGLFANDGLHFSGPLALLVGDDASTRLTAVHSTIFNVILLLVWSHVVAVGFYLFVKGHNLVKAMVTGKSLTLMFQQRRALPSPARISHCCCCCWY